MGRGLFPPSPGKGRVMPNSAAGLGRPPAAPRCRPPPSPWQPSTVCCRRRSPSRSPRRRSRRWRTAQAPAQFELSDVMCVLSIFLNNIFEILNFDILKMLICNLKIFSDRQFHSVIFPAGGASGRSPELFDVWARVVCKEVHTPSPRGLLPTGVWYGCAGGMGNC